MNTRFLRSIVVVWLMISPLNVATADLTPTAGTVTDPIGTRTPIDFLSPIELHPPLRPLAAGAPQTITLQITPATLIANSGATAVITATVYDLTGAVVSGVNLAGIITPATQGSLSGLGITAADGTVTGTWTAGTVISAGTLEVTNGVVSGTANLELTAGALTTVTVAPGAVSVTAGLTTTFTASGSDAFGNAVAITPTWGTNGGSINAAGLFTAQITATVGRLVTATAEALSGTANVTVTAGPLNSITITPTAISVAAGSVHTFTASGFDQYGNVVALAPIWTTDGGTIDQTGVYTAQPTIAAGRLVTVAQGAFSATAIVSITAGPLMSITVSPNPATVSAGATQVFTSTGYDAFGNVVPIVPTWDTNGGVIDQAGVFTAQITATVGRLVTATVNTVSGTANIAINAASLHHISVAPTSASLTPGGTQTFSAQGFDQFNNVMPITPTWTTNGGSINASGLFTAQITATVGRLVTATVGVISGTASVDVIAGPLNQIVVSPTNTSVIAGATQTFSAQGFDQFNNAVPITPIWTTNGGSINASGLFTAQITTTVGRLVTATVGAISGTASVTVIAGPLHHINVTPTAVSLVVAATQTFSANGFDQFNNAVPITPTWTTNGGSINASGLFTAQITATVGRLVTATVGALSGTANVDLLAGPLHHINVTPTAMSLVVATTQTFSASGFDQFNNAVPITPTWATNGGSINASGLFTAQITTTVGRLVTATVGAISGTASVNLIAGPLHHINVTPTAVSLVVASTQTFSANGFDQFNNAVPITPTWTTNGGSINASGLFTAQITTTVGRLVTATVGAISGTASVTLIAGPLNQIVVSPAAVTLTVATTQTFSANGFDQFGNTVMITPVWTTNGGTISAGGLFTAQNNVAANRRVTATQGITSGFALVTLQPAAPYTLTVQPPTAVISAGQRITYTATATDIFGNSIGPVTGSTSFSISPAAGGAFAANVVTPTIKNTWIVTGVIGSAVGTATLTVTAAAFNYLTIEDAPPGSGAAVNAVTLSIYNTLTVYAAAYDVYDNLIGGQNAVWSGTGVVSGSLAPLSGSSTTFTPVISGTGIIRATANSVTDTTGTITVQAPSLRISKSASPNPLTPGSPLQYTIIYTNVGNAAAQNVIVTETYPLSASYFSAVPLPTSGNNIWSLGSLPVNDARSIVVFMTTPSQMPVGSILTNSVQVGAGKVATAFYSTTTAVNALPDLSASITASPNPVRPGDLLIYTIQYRNNGTAPVTNVRITETYPANVTFESATPSPDSGNNVWLTSNLNGQGDSRIITVRVRVQSPLTDTTVLDNRVVVSANEAPPYTTTQETLVIAPRLVLSQSTTPLTPTANALLTYTLLYTNSGSSYATNTIITDAVPLNTSFVGCEPIGCGVNAGSVTWNLGQVDQHSAGTVTVTVHINNNLPDGTVITNSARITSTDNVAAMTLLTSTVASLPDVTLTKNDGTAEIAANQLTTYVLTYTNAGTAPATNVLITDQLPDYTTFVGCSSCVAAGNGVYSFTLSNLPAGASGALTISTRLAPTLPAGLRAITNTAAISTSTAGDPLANNFAADMNAITTQPVLSLTVSHDLLTPYPGKIITYTVRYTNTSAMDTIGVVITTTRPAWLAGPPVGWTVDNGYDLYPIGDLAAGQSGMMTYVVTLPTTYTLTMTAIALPFMVQDSGPGGLPIAKESYDTLIGIPDLTIEQVIVPATVVPGKKFTVTLIIRNNGLGWACNPNSINCSGGTWVDAFIDPAVPPPSYPFQAYGDPFVGVPPVGPGLTVTIKIANISFTSAQQPRLYFKVDNFNCATNNACLPNGSQGGLVPEYDETNNVAGPIVFTVNKIYLPLIRR